jgi:hypothetical protein
MQSIAFMYQYVVLPCSILLRVRICHRAGHASIASPCQQGSLQIAPDSASGEAMNGEIGGMNRAHG